MGTVHPRIILLVCILGSTCLARASACAGQGSPDWRNVCNGRLISSDGGYQDQPQVVVRSDGGWACVFTLDAAHEGAAAQRVVSTISTDKVAVAFHATSVCGLLI